MKVRELMRTRPITVAPETEVGRLAKLMLEHRLSGLPVVGDEGKLLGMVTETDMVAKHARVHSATYFGILGGLIPIGTHHMDEEVKHVLAVTARDLMSDVIATTEPEADVDDAASLMVEEGANPIAVVEKGRVVGLIGHTEIIRLLLIEETDGDTGSR